MADNKRPIINEIATIRQDIDIYAGWIERLENPDPVLNTEAKGKGIRLYDEVDRDIHAGAILESRYLAVSGKEWEIIPASDKRQDKKIAEFVEKVLLDCNFTQFCTEILQAILYGFYCAEVIWQTDGTTITIRRLIAKHPRRFVFTAERELRMLTWDNMIYGMPVPDRKFIVMQYGDSDNPYGKGLGQRLWFYVWFKKNGIKFWMIFLDKFGSPTAVGKYPPGTPKTEQDDLLDAINLIQQETGIKIPDTMAIELLEAARAGNPSYQVMCEYFDIQIEICILGQTATTHGTPGKLGNEDSQNDTKEERIKATADLLCDCLNNSLIRWITDYNFQTGVVYPKIWFRVEPEADLKALAERDKIIVKDMGVEVSPRYFYDTYGIPEPTPEEKKAAEERKQQAIERFQSTKETTKGTKEQDEDEEQYEDKEDGKEFSEKSETDIDALESASVRKAQDAMTLMLAPLMSMIKDAKSFEEIGEKLYTFYPQMDSKSFQDLLARTLFSAGLTGYASAEDDK